MQALERSLINTNWITILLVVQLLLIFLLKGLDEKKLKAYIISLFKNGFIAVKTDISKTSLSFFYILIFIFSISVLSLLSYHLINNYSQSNVDGFYTFSIIFITLFAFFLIKWSLEYLLASLFLIKREVRFFFVSKSSYLYSISFLLYIGLVLVEYTELTALFITYLSVGLFLLRFCLHLVNNKKLIFSKLFYFFLYLCAFQIAPLFILFKLMF